jgi:hypothetical protein
MWGLVLDTGSEKLLLVFYYLLLSGKIQGMEEGRICREQLLIHYRKLLCRIYQCWLRGSFLLLLIIFHAQHTVCSLFCCSEIKDLTQEIRVGNFLALTKKDIKKKAGTPHILVEWKEKFKMPCRAAGRGNKGRQPPTTNEQQTRSRRRRQLQGIVAFCLNCRRVSTNVEEPCSDKPRPSLS